MAPVPETHAFLFEPGVWRARGSFREADGTLADASGTTRIAHGADGWTIEGGMEIAGAQPRRFENYYRVDPPGPGGAVLAWRSLDPATGELAGTFTVLGDAIFSLFRSPDGRMAGSECMTRLDARRYAVKGVFEAEGRIVGAWDVVLEREA